MKKLTMNEQIFLIAIWLLDDAVLLSWRNSTDNGQNYRLRDPNEWIKICCLIIINLLKT